MATPFVPAAIRAIGPGHELLAASDKFAIERLKGAADHHVTASAEHPAWIMPIAGECSAAWIAPAAGNCVADDGVLAPGTVWLADAPAQITLADDATVLVARVGGTNGR